jgi:hypothetical protein
MVFQIQLAKRQDTVPLTRDYIDAAKKYLRHDPLKGEGADRKTPLS